MIRILLLIFMITVGGLPPVVAAIERYHGWTRIANLFKKNKHPIPNRPNSLLWCRGTYFKWCVIGFCFWLISALGSVIYHVLTTWYV